MNTLMTTSLFNCQISNFQFIKLSFAKNNSFRPQFTQRRFRIDSNSDKLGTPALEEDEETVVKELQANGDIGKEEDVNGGASKGTVALPPVSPAIEKDLKKVVNKTAATFAPRASNATKNPAVPGTALYTVFEVQGYVSMLLGGALSFNIIFPSNEPDIWRLMGMWSIWMFTIPSLRARDCSNREKEALNYLFLLIPLLNIIIPFFWKSFAVVWSADTIAFFGMYAWKFHPFQLGWLQKAD
ncbi:transcriptional repressor [Ancistrocladus abbreviatus]